jgi:hypothetical protein
MADNYRPQFQHQDWRDNVDLVSAEDPVKGFNKRFRDLRLELQEIARIIGQINTSLVPPTNRFTFSPSFSPNGNDVSWSLTSGTAAKAVNQTGANGWLAVQLPQNSRIQSITVVGDKTGNVGLFQAQLIRQSLVGGNTTLVSLDLTTQPDAFQATIPIPVANNLVDNQTNKYLVTTRIVGADQAATARIFAIQFVCNQT